MAGAGVSGSSSFSDSSGSTNQAANNQKFGQMFGKKNLGGAKLVKPTFIACCLTLAGLMLKKKLGK